MESLVKNEFQLYSNLAKPLILNLPTPKDRILAAAWVKKCADDKTGSEQLRTTYLKMLLFCLQRRRLTGLFADDPDKYEELEELPLGYDLNELAKNIIEQELDERRDKAMREISGDTEVSVCYSTDCSPDLTEYVAAQDIPHFGVHVYYALSSKPINKWNRSEKAILPKGTRSAIETSITQGATGGSASEPSCVCTPRDAKVKSDEPSGEGEEESNLPECQRVDKKEEPEYDSRTMKKKKRPKRMGQSPPTHPIGEVHRVPEERVTPTWGTNLLDVREPTDIGKIETPTEEEIKLEEEVSRLLEAEEDQDEDESDGADEFKESTQDMLHIIDEWKQQKMDKPKRPSRLDKLGSKTGIKKPSSIKKPKIPVKGMKQPKLKRAMGKKPDNLPEEFAGWTEEELEEAGLTWADLMPIEDNVDDVLKEIEDQVMAQEDDKLFEGSPNIHIPYEPTDYDEMIREAEKDLLNSKTVYEIGAEEDQDIVDHYDDQMDDFGDEFNIYQAAEEMRVGSPAIQSRIPVTTPGRTPTPSRVRSSERIFAEEGDFVFKRRTSPFAPIQPPPKETQSRPLQHSFENEDFGERDPVMVQIFEEAKSAVQSIDQPQDQSSGSANVSTAERSRQQADFRGTPGSSQPERAPLGSPELDSLHFESKFRRQQGGLFDRSPVPESASPPQLSDDESFRMYESFYREQDSSPSERSTSARATSTPPAAAAEQDSRLQRAQLEIKAWEQETKLRQGSPEARRIIDEAQGQLMLGAPGVNEEAPFPTQKPQRVLPKPAFSPTTGSPLNVPSYDIQPDDLGVNYDDVLDIPPTPFPPCGYSSPPAAQRDDLFTRLGAPEITTDDFRPRPPQYFHPGLDIAADDSPPPPLCMEEQICESASGGGYVRPPRPVSDLSPVREKYFDEEVYKFFEETEHKGQRVDARPMSPWRNESIYYTPEVDRTLSVEYPLDSPPPRPFVPGVSSPVTPPCQLPIQRPGGYDTPHDYGAQFDMLPDHYPPDQRTPIEPRPIPGMSEFDRAPCRGAVKDSWRKVASPRGRRRHLGAAGTFDSAGEDQYEDFQTPRRNLSQCRARLFPTPEGEAGPSRRPTGSTPPFYNSDFESPPPAPVPVQRFPAAKRIKKRGKYPEPEPPVSDIPHFSLPWEDGIQEQQNPPDYDDVRFRAKYRFCNDNLFDSPPALEPGSPLQGSGLQDTFEMYESFYRDQDSGSGRSTPTRGACQESCTPPPPDRDQQLKRAQLELKAWEQEMNLRQGSPEAAGPAGIPTVMDEQAPFSTQRPQRMPPKPAFSPTTGSQLPVPDYDIQPDDLGVSYDEGLDFRSFSPCRPGGSSSPQAAEQGDLFTRLGAPEITTDDNRPPQYFHPGLDIATDESPPPPLYFSDYEVSSFEERVRPPRSSCLSPVRETQYDEEIYRSFEDVEYKGKHVDVRPMSPWRNESIYYTPETDRTLSLDSSAPTQFIPGVTSPATPPCQFPVQRPDSFATPDYGDGILDVTPPPFNVFDEYSPCQEGAGARQRSPALSPLSTPEGVAGPSNRRRRFYNSDFESPPTPSPPRVQRFPVAKKIKKRGRYPPEPELPLPDIPQFGLQWENELRAQQQQQINENLGDPAFVSRFEDEQYSFNETPPDLQQYDNLVGQVSPCIPRTPTAPPITPSSYPPIRTPRSVPSGSPRTPPLPRAPLQVEAPCVATRGTGSRRIPVPRAKPDIYTTRSQVLRMKKMEQQRDAAQKISPVSKRLQENRARLARIDEDRKLAAARRQQQPSQRRSIPRLRDASSRTRAAPCQLPQGTTRPRPVPTSGLRPPAAGRPSGIRPPAAGRSSGEPPSPYSEEPAHLSFAAQGQVCPGAGAPSIHDADEQELREFEQLEREMVAEGQGQVCPGATALPDDAPDQSDLRRRLFEQQMAIQGPPRTGLQYPAEGITYSPQRPMETFGHMPPRPIQTRPLSPCAVPYSPSQEEMAPKSLRKHIKATADARFHPGQRRDLSREDRRVMRGPPLSMHNIPERPTDAATTFMGPYMRPSQKQKQKEMERIGRDIKFYKSDAGRQVMEMERRHGMRRELVAPCSPVGEEDHPFDEPIPRGLPPPLAPHHGSPIRRPHYTRVVDPFPQVELQPLQFENFGPCGPPPLHPDLREVAEWEPPFDLGETTALSAESHGDELMYSPEPLPGPEPLTPPSVGKGPCGTYSPATSPPLGILESPDLRMYDPHDLKIFDEHLADQEDVRSFFDRSPQPGPSTGVEADFDFFLETKSAKGREGLKPKPQFFGGYGEKPKKYLPRWYGQRGPNLNIISEEGDIPPSPPVSSHDTTCGPCDTSGLDEYLLLEQQLAQEAASHQNSLAFDERRRQVAITDMAEQADRQLIMSPEQREFEMLEEQMSQQRRPGRTSGRREFADRSRRAMIDEMAEEAERNWMDRMRVPSPPQWAPSSPQRVPSPCPVETFGPELGSRLDTSGVMDQSFGQYVTPPCSPAAREEFEQFTPPISPRGIGVCTPQLPEAGNLADIYQEDTRGFLEESFIGAQSPLNLSDGGVPGYDYEGAEQMVLGDAGGFPEMSGIPGAGTLEEETFPELSPGRRNPNLERYIENMQRQQEAVRLEEQASRQRRMQRYSNAMEELYQQNLPSPVSPGPDADFLANVYMHHVPPSFAQGERLYMRGGMPRRAPCPGLDTITEPRVRITSPKPSPKRHKHKHGKQVVPPPPRPGRTFSARRVEEARKLYREISRQTETSMLSERSRLAQRQGAVPRPRGVAPSIARPSAQPPPPRPFTGFVPSQVASQSGARSRVIQQQGAVPRYEGVRRPFTGFVPSQVQAPSQGRAGSGGSGQGRSGCGGSGQGRSGCGGSGQGKSGCGSQ